MNDDDNEDELKKDQNVWTSGPIDMAQMANYRRWLSRVLVTVLNSYIPKHFHG